MSTTVVEIAIAKRRWILIIRSSDKMQVFDVRRRNGKDKSTLLWTGK